VKVALEGAWTTGWHNQCPGLYCDTTGNPAAPYPPEQLANMRDSSGGGNVRFYFCDAEGRVVHYLAGYWKPESLLAELRFAEALLANPREAGALRRDRLESLIQEHAAAEDRARRALARRIRCLKELPVGRPVAEVLREIEDDVYRKGAIG
jgi:hypothetical protein